MAMSGSSTYMHCNGVAAASDDLSRSVTVQYVSHLETQSRAHCRSECHGHRSGRRRRGFHRRQTKRINEPGPRHGTFRLQLRTSATCPSIQQGKNMGQTVEAPRMARYLSQNGIKWHRYGMQGHPCRIRPAYSRDHSTGQEEMRISAH